VVSRLSRDRALASDLVRALTRCNIDEILVDQGDRLDLICRATGDPEPTVSWYKRSVTHSELR
jgi:hypothetical protein